MPPLPRLLLLLLLLLLPLLLLPLPRSAAAADDDDDADTATATATTTCHGYDDRDDSWSHFGVLVVRRLRLVVALLFHRAASWK